MSTYTDSLKVHGVPLDIDWHIDVDSPQIDSVYVTDGGGDDIHALLDPAVIAKITRFMHQRMTEMEREVKAWKGQYNNV